MKKSDKIFDWRFWPAWDTNSVFCSVEKLRILKKTWMLETRECRFFPSPPLGEWDREMWPNARLAWMLEIGSFFMRTEMELVLKSRRVFPGRLLQNGFSFKFPTWPEAARDLCRQRREIRGSRK